MGDAPVISESVTAALLQEHDELVQLIIHEEYVSWQLNVVLIGANSALLGALHSLGLLDRQQQVGVALGFLLVVGLIINLVGVFVLQRRGMYRLARLHRGCRIEAELALAGSPIRTFSSVERTIAAGRMLAPPESSPPPPAPQPTRPLRLHERVRFLNFRLAFYLVALMYAALAIWAVTGRP